MRVKRVFPPQLPLKLHKCRMGWVCRLKSAEDLQSPIRNKYPNTWIFVSLLFFFFFLFAYVQPRITETINEFHTPEIFFWNASMNNVSGGSRDDGDGKRKVRRYIADVSFPRFYPGDFRGVWQLDGHIHPWRCTINNPAQSIRPHPKDLAWP